MYLSSLTAIAGRHALHLDRSLGICSLAVTLTRMHTYNKIPFFPINSYPIIFISLYCFTSLLDLNLYNKILINYDERKKLRLASMFRASIKIRCFVFKLKRATRWSHWGDPLYMFFLVSWGPFVELGRKNKQERWGAHSVPCYSLCPPI